MQTQRIHRPVLSLTLALVSILLIGSLSIVRADDDIQRFNIDKQPLPKALLEFSRQSNIDVMAPSQLVAGKQSPPVNGEMSSQEALNKLLASSGLNYKERNDGSITIVRADSKKGANRPLTVAQAQTSQEKTKATIKRAEKADATGNVIEEIIVTSQKREQSVFDVPISVVAMDADELEARGVNNLQELALAVPGLSVVDTGARGRQIYIRGVSNRFGSGTSLVGVYLDEIPVTAAEQAFQLDLRPYDLERVEVLRGPQGTIYGVGSVGGTIRFVSKSPDLESLALEADVSASFTEDGSPSQKIQSVLNMPLIEDELGLRIAGTFENSGGWIDQPVVNDTDINDENVTNIRIKGLWQPVDALRVEAAAVIHRNEAGAANFGEDDNGNYMQAFNRTTTPKFEDDYDIYNLTLSYEFDSVQFLSATSYVDQEKDNSEFGNFLPLAPPPGAVTHSHVFSEQADVSVFSEELRLTSTATGKLHWSLGWFYQDTSNDFTNSGQLGIPGVFIFPSAIQTEETSKSWAVFGNTSFALTDWLELGVGLRYFEDDREFVDLVALTTQEEKFDTLNPRFYASVGLTDTATAYASATKGFRSGGFNSFGQPSFDPELVWTYELGTKMTHWGGQLIAELAFFYTDYSDRQELGFVTSIAQFITSNAGDAEMKGVDWALTWRASDRLSLSFSGNYIDTEVTEIDVAFSSHAVGDRLDEIPKYQFALSANYDFVWGEIPGFVRLDYNQRGKALFRIRSIGPHYQSNSDVINMLNFRANWQVKDNISLGVFGHNMLDDRGFLGSDSIQNFASRTRPRTLGVELGLDF